MGPRVEGKDKVRSEDRLRVRGMKKEDFLAIIDRDLEMVGPVELLKEVEKVRFRKKARKISENLKKLGVLVYYRQLSYGITTKLVSKCDGERVLTLPQKADKNSLRIAEHMISRGSCTDEEKERWTSESNSLKRRIHQVNLATKLVSSPLHHTQDRGGPLSKEEERLSCLEKHLATMATRKMPPGLKSLLGDKLNEHFGPSFDLFVRALILNITMHLFMPWNEYFGEQYHYVHLDNMNAYSPTEQDLLVDLLYMFRLSGLPQPFSAEDIVEAIVKKIDIAFAEASTPEDKLTLDMYKMSLAQPQD